jgi:hypothetical protein
VISESVVQVFAIDGAVVHIKVSIFNFQIKKMLLICVVTNRTINSTLILK